LTSQSYGDKKISGGEILKTPELTDKYFGMGDYVGDDSPQAKIQKMPPMGRGGVCMKHHITLAWFLVFPSFFVTSSFARVSKLNHRNDFYAVCFI